MKSGDSIKRVVGKGPPLLAPELGAVAAARSAGLKFSGDKSLLYYMEETDSGPQPTHVWTFDGNCRVTLHVPHGTEEIELNEFVKRFTDLTWCEANPWHPISYMRAMWDQLTMFRDALRHRKPHTRLSKTFTRDDGTLHTVDVYLDPEASPEDRAEFLAKFDAIEA